MNKDTGQKPSKPGERDPVRPPPRPNPNPNPDSKRVKNRTNVVSHGASHSWRGGCRM